MSVTVTNIGFRNSLSMDSTVIPPVFGQTTSLQPNVFKGGIGEYISVGIDFQVKWGMERLDIEFIAPNTIRIQTFDPANFSGGLGSTNSENSTASFLNFFETGDKIQFDPATVTTPNDVVMTIQTITDDTITVDVTVIDEVAPFTSVFGVTPIKALDFVYNIIENDDSNDFRSKITDKNQNTFFSSGIDALVATPVILRPTGDKNWQANFSSDEPTILIGQGITDFTQKFTLIHNFHLIDLIDTNFDDNGNPSVDLVEELVGNLSQKYIFDIRVKTNVFSGEPKFSFLDTDNVVHYDQILKNGNTGFFDELYNGYTKSIEISSLAYEDTLTNPIDSLLSNDPSVVKITIQDSQVGGSFNFFDTASTEGIAQVVILEKPNDTNLLDVDKTYFENLNYSRVMFSWNQGGAFVNQQIDGTLINSLTGTLTANQTMDLEVGINATGSLVTSNEYLIFFSTWGFDESFNEEVTQSLLVDSNTATTQAPVGYCSSTGVFEQHGGIVSENIVANIEDVINAKITLTVDKNATLGTNIFDIDLESLEIQIIAEHQTTPSRNFVVQNDVFSAGVSNYGNSGKGFSLTLSNLDNICSWNEDFGSETPTQKFYILDYPFKLRWEEWVSVNTDSDFQLTDFQDWAQFEQHPDWELKFNVLSKSELTNQTDNSTSFNTITKEFDFEYLKDYEEVCPVTGFNATYDALSVEVFELASLTPLTVLLTDKDMLIKATFQGDWNSTPLYPFDIYGILRFDAIDVGGIGFVRRISSIEDVVPNDIWNGLDITGKQALVTINDTVFPYTVTVEAILKGNKITSNIQNFKVSATIGAVKPLTCAPVCPPTAFLEDVTLDCMLEDVTLDPLLED